MNQIGRDIGSDEIVLPIALVLRPSRFELSVNPPFPFVCQDACRFHSNSHETSHEPIYRLVPFIRQPYPQFVCCRRARRCGSAWVFHPPLPFSSPAGASGRALPSPPSNTCRIRKIRINPSQGYRLGPFGWKTGVRKLFRIKAQMNVGTGTSVVEKSRWFPKL